MPEMSSVKRFRAMCSADREALLALLPWPTHSLYPISIIREQVQNINSSGSTDKGNFIGFLFPNHQKGGSKRPISP
jgi:hypothetical protein